jgi:hypothetical protein
MSELDSLTSQANKFTSEVDFWNSWVVWALFITAIAALAIVVGQKMANVRAKQLSDVELQIAAIKEANLKTRADQLQQGLADSEKETARLKKIAEDERLARVKIEERLAWRRVDPTLYQKFVKELTPFAGSVVSLNPLGNGDPETDTFAEDIAKLFHDSHWKALVGSGNIAIPAPRGLICRVDESSAAGKALAAVLKQLPGAVIIPTALQGTVAAITVGLRPPP